MEDDKMAILEAQLAQAKQIAEEADRKYEEVKLRPKNAKEKSCITPNTQFKAQFCCFKTRFS